MAAKLRLNPRLIVREEADGAILFDPESGTVRVLNPSAHLIARLLDGHHDKTAVLERLRREFPQASHAQLDQDYDAFTQSLVEAQLAGSVDKQ